MTVTNETYKSPLYYGNNVTTTFPTAFQFSLPEDLRVDISNLDSTFPQTLVYGSQYTLIGFNNPAGGTVVLTTPLPSTKKLRIIRNTPYTQTTDYTEGTNFPAETHEHALDRLTYITQTLQAKLERAPLLPSTSAYYPQVFPDGGMANRGKLLRWDPASGSNLQAVSPTELTLVGDINIKDLVELNFGDTIDYTIVYDVSDDVNKKVKLGNLPFGGSGAPTGLSYITVNSESSIPNERVLTGGANCTITDNGPSSTVVIDVQTAPITASYITVSSEAGLSNERYLTTSGGLLITDNGPNTNVLLSIIGPSRTQTLAVDNVRPHTSKTLLYHSATALGWASFAGGVNSPSISSDNSYNIASVTRITTDTSALPFLMEYDVTLANVGYSVYGASCVNFTCQSTGWTGHSGDNVLTDYYKVRTRASNQDQLFLLSPGTCSVVIFGIAKDNY